MADPSQLTDASWQERAFVTITKKGGNDKDFHALLDEIGFSGGDKDFDATALMNGGRIRVRSNQEPYEFTGTLYPTGPTSDPGASTDPRGIMEFFHGSSDTGDNDSHFKYEASHTRDDFRVAVMFTNDTSVTSAVDSVSGSSKQAYRYVQTDAHLVSAEPSFDDQVLTVEVTFRSAPFDETASPNAYVEGYTGDSSDTMSSLGSY